MIAEGDVSPIVAGFAPSLLMQSSTIGTLQWRPSPDLALKLSHASKPGHGVAALGEIEHAVGILLTALTESVGDKRRAMKLNHLITEIANSLNPTVPHA